MAVVATSYGNGVYQAAEKHQLWIPQAWKYDQTKRGLIYCHGAGTDYNIDGVCKALADAGIPVIGADLGGAQTWGSDTSLTRVTTAWNFLKTAANVKTDKMLLWGASMGGITSSIYTLNNAASVRALGLVIPALDPEYIRVNNLNGYQANIEAIYGAGASVPTGKQPKLQGTALAALGVPIKMWYSTNDPFTPLAINTQFASDAGAPTVSLGAVAHSYVNIVIQQALDFFNQYVSS